MVIVGFEYGSTDPANGKSFTEIEYEAALASNKPVIAFLKNLPPGAGELEPRVAAFRDRLSAERVCKFWDSPGSLVHNVIDSLRSLKESHPMPGWIRGDSVPDGWEVFEEQILAPAMALGIKAISPNGNSGPSMSAALTNAERISIMATSGLRIIEMQKSSLAEAVARGADLSVLVPQRSSEFVHDVERIERRDSEFDDINRELGVVRARLREIWSQAHGLAGEKCGAIHIGSMSTHLRSTFVLTQDWGWVTLTLPPLRTPETASFELGTIEVPGGLLWAAQSHFDAVWKIVEADDQVKLITRV